jgi:predicted ferric reductase
MHPILLAGPQLVESWKSAIEYFFDFSNSQMSTGWIAFGSLLLGLLFTFWRILPFHWWKRTHILLGYSLVASGVHVVAVRKLDTRTVEVELKSDSKKFLHAPGQFAYLATTATPGRTLRQEWHPFTICSGNNETNLRFCIRASGKDTARLQELIPGDQVAVEGPFGKFFDEHESANESLDIWVAGGIGITPFLSRLRSGALVNKTKLFCCVREKQEALFLDELKSYNSLDLVVHESQNCGWPSVAMLGNISPSTQIYLCGPALMQRNLRKGLVSLGVSNRSIHSEEFSLL